MLEIEDATRRIGQRLVVAKAGNDAELDAAFALLIQQRVSAMLVAASAYFDTRRERIIEFAAKSRLPAIYQLREYAVSGGLISYGPNIAASYREAGIYDGRILRGAKPADLPVLQPTRFELGLTSRPPRRSDAHVLVTEPPASGSCYLTLFAGPEAEQRAPAYHAALEAGTLKVICAEGTKFD